MVDDFTNVWIDLNNNGRVDAGEDWGHAMNSPHSSFRFLTSQILDHWPAVKTTFFTPVARVPMLRDYKCKAHFGPINETEEMVAFFRAVHEDERFEIAYHGLTHGVSGKDTGDFVQEWASYKSLEEALEAIQKGKRIYFDVFGQYPTGGKYCGYEYNAFSDESIERSGFLWWCRSWDRGEAGSEEIERFDVRYFGVNKVIDIPSTVHGALFTEPKNRGARAFRKRAVLKDGIAQLEHLLKNRLVISIQEHISPARTDGRRQTPNIFDDKTGLKTIFDYLKDKHAWYCTGTELAKYVQSRDNVTVEETEEGFRLRCALEGIADGRRISLIVSDEKVRKIRAPDGELIARGSGVFNVRVTEGLYSTIY